MLIQFKSVLRNAAF